MLVGQHMRPFHLIKSQQDGEVTTKACIRLIKMVGDELPGLFLLAMADAMAGKGERSPVGIEEDLVALFARVESVRRNNVVPVLVNKPLITGEDLINQLHLSPGPLFGIILNAVRDAQMEKKIRSREEALLLAEEVVQAKALDNGLLEKDIDAKS